MPVLSNWKVSCDKMRFWHWMTAGRSVNTLGSSRTRDSKPVQGRICLWRNLTLTSPSFWKPISSFEYFLLFAGVQLLSISRRSPKIVPASDWSPLSLSFKAPQVLIYLIWTLPWESAYLLALQAAAPDTWVKSALIKIQSFRQLGQKRFLFCTTEMLLFKCVQQHIRNKSLIGHRVPKTWLSNVKNPHHEKFENNKKKQEKTTGHFQPFPIHLNHIITILFLILEDRGECKIITRPE